MKRDLTVVADAKSWATRINKALGASAQATIEAGRELCAAKDALEHGEWGRLFDDKLIPLSQRSANCLMAVARNPVLSNSQRVANLPSSWGTLYELTKLPEPVLEKALSNGTITPETQRKAVTALLASPTKRAAPKAALWDSAAASERLLDAIEREFSVHGAQPEDKQTIAYFLKQHAKGLTDENPT
jgi:hypothetical protein